MNKSGILPVPKIVFAVDSDAHTVHVPTKGWERANVTFEDNCFALHLNLFAHVVQAAMNAVEDIIEYVLSSEKENEDCGEMYASCSKHPDADFSDGAEKIANIFTICARSGDCVCV